MLVSLLDLQCASALHGSSSSWTVVRPTRVPKHRAQCAGDGRRARRLAEVRAEPFPASLLVRRHSCALLVATSRQAASRDEQPRGLRPASSSCCRRGAAERARAATRVRVPGRPAGHGRKQAFANRCPCSARASGGHKYEQQQRLKIQTIRFAVDGRRIAPKEKFDKTKPPLRARLPPVVIK